MSTSRTSTPPESVEHEIGATVEAIGQIEPRHEQPEMPTLRHVIPRVVGNDVEPHVGLLAFGPRPQALRPPARPARREVHVVDAVRIERRARLDRRITTTEADVGIVETVPEHARMHRQRLVKRTGPKITTTASSEPGSRRRSISSGRPMRDHATDALKGRPRRYGRTLSNRSSSRRSSNHWLPVFLAGKAPDRISASTRLRCTPSRSAASCTLTIPNRATPHI